MAAPGEPSNPSEPTRPDRPGAAEPTRPLPEASAELLSDASDPEQPCALADPAAPLGVEQPGRYQERYLEGQGGQARVLNVLDGHLGRRVALKELAWTPRAASKAERRFLLEARVASRLEHPNIVPVHEVGRRADGRLYYTMRLVHGETLSARLTRCQTLGERLGLLGAFWDTCKAIAYAHSRGVVHRDLKPANVMLGRFGETVLLDWGLAKLKGAPAGGLEGDPVPAPPGPELTSGGMALGTPSYMSPEQARGEEIDERTDVWGLGAVLYRLLTGEAPFARGDHDARVAQARAGEVRPVRALCPEAPPELAAIAHRCLQREPGRRYQSAAELASEIGAYLTGGRVRSYSYSPWELLRRFAADHRGAVIASAVALAAIVAGLVAVSVALREQTRARAQEQRERRLAELHLSAAYSERADRLLADHRFASAHGFAALSLLHNPAHPTSPSHAPDFARAHPRSALLRVRAASTALQARQHFTFVRERVLPVGSPLGVLDFAPDGDAVAVAAYDGAAHVWSLGAGAERLRLAGDGLTTYAAVFSPDGATLATAGKGGALALWRVSDGARLAELAGHQGGVRGLAFSPDGRRLASAGADRTVRLWDLEARQARAVLRGHAAEARAVRFSRDGRRLYSGGVDRTVRVWDLEAGGGAVLATLASSVRSLALSPDGARLAVGCDEPTITVLDARTGAPGLMLGGNESMVRQVDWSPDGELIASAGFDRTVRVWNADSGEPLATLEEHGASVCGVAFSPDGARLASADFDGVLQVWRLRPGPLLGLADGEAALLDLAFSPDGARLATASRDGSLRVWDLPSRRLLRTFPGELQMDARVAFGAGGALVAAAGGAVELWSVETGERVLRLPLASATAVRFAPGGERLAVGEDTGAVGLWSLAGERVRAFAGHRGTVFDVDFSADGRTLASAGKDGVVRLWDVESGAPRGERRARDWVTSLDFAPDGRLAAASKDGLTLVWDPTSGAERLRLEHGQWTLARFVGDGRSLATVCDDQYVRFWDAHTGELRRMVRTPREMVGMDVSPDGRRLALSQGRGLSVYPIDLSPLEADPRAMLEEARGRGFVEPVAAGADPSPRGR